MIEAINDQRNCKYRSMAKRLVIVMVNRLHRKIINLSMYATETYDGKCENKFPLKII